MIDLDCLLYPAPGREPTWEEVQEFWQHGEFDSEEYLVAAIEKWLQTTDQRQRVFDAGLSIEKILNGRYGAEQEPLIDALFSVWNEKLGFKSFGF